MPRTPGRWRREIFRLLKGLAVAILAVAAVVTFLHYAFGLTFELYGGGVPRFRFAQSAADRAAEIEAHRAAQRATAAVAPPESATPAERVTPPAAPAPAPAAAAAGERPAASGTTIVSDTVVSAAYWTDFRGPARDGAYAERAIRGEWPVEGLTPIWRVPIGAGYASTVVARGRIFTIEQRGKEEVVAAYDLRSGRELWTNRWTALFSESMGGDGPRATPTWADGRVVALGGAGELRVLDEGTGRVVWRKNILEDNGATNIQWGMATSPLVVGGKVVVQPGASGGKSVVAYDAATGARVWSVLDDQSSYASPMHVTLAGVPQILMVTATRLVALAPDSGAVIWETPWVTPGDINAAQPVVISANRVFYSSGTGVGAAVFEVSAADGRWNVREVWRNIRMKNQFSSSVLFDGHLYGLDENILACIDAATGLPKWKGGRYGYGQLIRAGDRLIVQTEDGDLALVRATPDGHQELGKFTAIPGKSWNVPSLADGILIVRNTTEMAAFDVK